MARTKPGLANNLQPAIEQPPQQMPQCVGFFQTYHGGGLYTAAVLVTDLRGIPLEFKHVVPLRPEKLQKIAFGLQMEEYIKNLLMKEKLLQSLRSRPLLFFSNWDEWTLGGKMGPFDHVAVRQEPAGRAAVVHDHQAEQRVFRVSDTDVVFKSEQRKNIQVRFFIEDLWRQDQLLGQIVSSDASMDILEPLDRVDQAVQFLIRRE